MDARDRLGTRFLLYPQVPHVSGYGKPEPVWISTAPSEVHAGPSDSRMYVADPLVEKPRYGFPYLPPYSGALHPPAEPGPDGHFDHLAPGTRQFNCAHVFGCLRRIQDIWESYLGRPVTWYFRPTRERLEIVPQLDWFNAHSGFGFMEFGLDRGEDGKIYPFALNFDVVAHEFGHTILLSEIGAPASLAGQSDYRAYHEAASDLISLISLLHFDSVLDRLLRRTRGNLLTANELSRLAELVGDRQIRLVSNDLRMSDTTTEAHNRSRPLTGAVFDTLVQAYHGALVARGLADVPAVPAYDRLSPRDLDRLDAALAEGFSHRPLQFKAALADARDAIGMALAASWAALNPNALTLAGAGRALAGALARADAGPVADTLTANLQWRELLPRPRVFVQPRPEGIHWRHPAVI